jgi:hypothetical protein
MPGPDQLPRETLLACIACGTQQPFELNPTQMIELVRNGQLRLPCPACGTVTSWYGLEPDRRTGTNRRSSRHSRLQLRIRVRCSSPELVSTEVATTTSASLHGASFISSRRLTEGMVVHVILPYSEGDTESLERRARVVRVEPGNGVNEIAVQFLT